MKIEFFGKSELVRSVHAQQVVCGVQIIVNLADRSSMVEYQGGSIHFKEGREHSCFIVNAGDGSETHCEIVLVPENDEEKIALSQCLFMLHEKDQAVIQYVERAQLESVKTLATATPHAPKKDSSPSFEM